MGQDSASFVQSDLAGRGLYPVVAFEGGTAARPTLSSPRQPRGPAGTVLGESDDLEEGQVTAAVHANRTAVVLLKATYDPGWTVKVDGRLAKTEMIAPAYVGVRVGPGTHVVTFRYQPYANYPELFGLAGLALILLGIGPWLLRRRTLSRADSNQTLNAVDLSHTSSGRQNQGTSGAG